jgi:hypothetical protein
VAARQSPAANGHFRSRPGEMECARGLRGNGEHATAAQGEKRRSEGAGSGVRARRLRSWRCTR